MGILLCVVCFIGSFWLGRHSIVAGLGSVLTAGYFYGILRANFFDTYSYFLFDSAVVGYYLSFAGTRPAGAGNPAIRPLRGWVMALLGWALVMSLMPIQHPLIQLVGLRGNAFLVPFVLVGGWLARRDYDKLAYWLAALNIVAFGFAAAEYLVGVPNFFPLNAATQLIYNSNDVAGYTAMRIPATFVNAHGYAGTMVGTLPWLLGALVQRDRPRWVLPLLVAGLLAALLGMFLTATRIAMVVMFVLVAVATFSGELRGAFRLGWVALLGLVVFVVSGEERMQRILTLSETGRVAERIEGSINFTFLELLLRYPMGNGMGAGGTSVPYFLQHLVRDPVGLENEYARMLLEQGLVGLVLWVGFFGWLLTRSAPSPGSSWRLGWRLLWCGCACACATGLLSMGLMTAIPGTPLLFLGMGMLAAYRGDPAGRRRRRPVHAAPAAQSSPRDAAADPIGMS